MHPNRRSVKGTVEQMGGREYYRLGLSIRHQPCLVPTINQVPGFRAYSLVQVGDKEVVIISAFDSLADAKESARHTAVWVAEHTEVFLQGSLKAEAGEVRVHSAFDRLPQTGEQEQLQGTF